MSYSPKKRVPQPPPLSDGRISAALRDIEVPWHLEERLRQIPSDELLASKLQEMRVPQDLNQRIKESMIEDDAGIDCLLRAVSLPKGLGEKLCEVVIEPAAVPEIEPNEEVTRRSRFNWRQAGWVSAVSVAVSFLFFVSFLEIWSKGQPEIEGPVANDGKFRVNVGPNDGPIFKVPGPGPEPDTFVYDLPRLPEYYEEPIDLTPYLPLEMQLHRDGMLSGIFNDVPGSVPKDEGNATTQPSTPEQVAKTPVAPTPAVEEIVDVLAHQETIQNTINTVIIPSPAVTPRLGVQFPFNRRYNHQFLWKERVQPFVTLLPPKVRGAKVDDPLRITRVPLESDASHFEYALRMLDLGRRPYPSEMRPESFLAAFNYELPKPEGDAPFSLFISGGPSLLSPSTFHQICVGLRTQDWTPKPQETNGDAKPTHWIFVLDTTLWTHQTGRIEQMGRALSQWLTQQQPDDLISLVGMGEKAYLHLEKVPVAMLRSSKKTMREMLATTVSTSDAKMLGNYQAGLEMGYELAGKTENSRLVMMTDAPESSETLPASETEEKLPRTDILRLGVSNELLLYDDALFHSMADKTGGIVDYPTSTRTLLRSLRELASDNFGAIAENVKLYVEFNQAAVFRYRQLGHEMSKKYPPNSPAGDVYPSEETAGVYDIILRSGKDPNEVVATVKVIYPRGDSAGDGNHTIVKKLRRKDIATKFADTPVAHQQMALVVATAEVMRQSYFNRKARESLSIVRLLKYTQLAADLLSVSENADAFAPLQGFLEKVLEVEREMLAR